MDLTPEIRSWIGRSTERVDTLSDRLVTSFKAALAPHVTENSDVPPGIFWCLSPDIVSPDLLGQDGHPRLGQFLPELPLPRRMWAGGELTFHGAFKPGDLVTKRSTIADITAKSGKTGELCFVTLRHEYHARGSLIVSERQDVVYREAAGASSTGAAEITQFVPPRDAWTVNATPTLLFRYSALTFNGHRIHYDFPYATEVEGYAGLVVHGPMQATLMLTLAAEKLRRMPNHFSYRGLAPLICGKPFFVVATPNTGKGYDLSTLAADGTTTMSATAA